MDSGDVTITWPLLLTFRQFTKGKVLLHLININKQNSKEVCHTCVGMCKQTQGDTLH